MNFKNRKFEAYMMLWIYVKGKSDKYNNKMYFYIYFDFRGSQTNRLINTMLLKHNLGRSFLKIKMKYSDPKFHSRKSVKK